MAEKKKQAAKPKTTGSNKAVAVEAEKGYDAKKHVAALAGRLAILESIMQHELGINPADHAAALARTPGGPAGDAGSE